ncbi:MAG: DinB family protein [Planctomycetota bacterium]|nr:MAG: DinB family protein [Planctomycetota bacterium]
MTAKDVIKRSIDLAHSITEAYLGDLTDADLMRRPHPKCNHIAWQLGHLIGSEHEMMTGIGATMPELPAGFAEAHSKETAGSDDASKFATKDEYLSLMSKLHAATKAALDAADDADLDKEAPEPMRGYAPTVGDVFALIAAHELMHVGQFVPVRRALDKPITI